MADPATIGGTIGGIVGGIIIGVAAALRALRPSTAEDRASSANLTTVDIPAILARLAALEAAEANRVKATEDAAEALARKTFTRTLVSLTKELREAKKEKDDERRTDPPTDP